MTACWHGRLFNAVNTIRPIRCRIESSIFSRHSRLYSFSFLFCFFSWQPFFDGEIKLYNIVTCDLHFAGSWSLNL